MLEPKLDQAKVAVLSGSAQQRKTMQSALESTGLDVVVCDAVGDQFLAAFTKNPADILLVDLSDNIETDMVFVDALLEHSELPVLYSDDDSSAVTGKYWGKKLARKLNQLVLEYKNMVGQLAEPDQKEPPSNAMVAQSGDTAETQDRSVRPREPKEESVSTTVEKGAEHTNESSSVDAAAELEEHSANPLDVWVLGASLGGPQAVRLFLETIQSDIPVAFILAQHIGANHVPLLADQLNRITKLKVVPATNGHRLKIGEVVLTPADKRLTVTNDGFVVLKKAPEKSIYSPSIDSVMMEIAKQYKGHAGAIIFSGMGNDGAKGGAEIAKHGGAVWAQDVESCIMSSMPDHARKTNTVTYSANPAQLAEKLYGYYCDQNEPEKKPKIKKQKQKKPKKDTNITETEKG